MSSIIEVTVNKLKFLSVYMLIICGIKIISVSVVFMTATNKLNISDTVIVTLLICDAISFIALMWLSMKYFKG